MPEKFIALTVYPKALGWIASTCLGAPYLQGVLQQKSFDVTAHALFLLGKDQRSCTVDEFFYLCYSGCTANKNAFFPNKTPELSTKIIVRGSQDLGYRCINHSPIRLFTLPVDTMWFPSIAVATFSDRSGSVSCFGKLTRPFTTNNVFASDPTASSGMLIPSRYW